jgi:hypothetical protein
MDRMQRAAAKRSTIGASPSQQDIATSSSSNSSDAGERAVATEINSVADDEQVRRHPPSWGLESPATGLPTPRAIFTLVSCLFW